MQKPKFETPDLTAGSVTKIAELFPGVVAEGKINFDLLRAMLGDEVFADEAYEFTWVGKRAAIAEAGKPIRKTLRPCVEESKDWDTTENLYIEGDNLDVLKLLQESYLGKVKMIYIDPPYNTGNDFVYRDSFAQSREEYEDEAGAYDDGGERLVRNVETNGRFHSDWCSMMYPRLVLARNMLRENGVIFISIDDGETHNLRKICDEVFGEHNCIAEICHKSRASVSNDKIISPNHNTILLYANNYEAVHETRRYIGLDPDLSGFNSDDNDGRGKYRLVPVDGPGGAKKGNPFYEFLGIEGYWRFSQKTMQEKFDAGLVVKKGSSLYQKYFMDTAKETRRTDTTWWDDGGLMSTATSKLKSLMGESTFDTPKPVELVTRMLKLFSHFDKDCIVLDFFSGSATTAHAVMQLNAEDKANGAGLGKRKFIMVQLPEVCAEGTEAAKAGYKNICEIGKERIRRAGDKIKDEAGLTAQELDTGFRVLKLDDTNMNDVYYAAGDYTQNMLSMMESNIKPDRTDMDLLYGCLLDWGLPLSMPHTQEEIDGFTVHTYNGGDLIACFEERISEKAIREIAGRRPLRAVFRDSSFASSPEKINVFEIFKLLSPNTNVKVI